MCTDKDNGKRHWLHSWGPWVARGTTVGGVHGTGWPVQVKTCKRCCKMKMQAVHP